MRRKNFKLSLAIALLALFTLVGVTYPALALLREHHQSSGILRYHAQHSIQDREQRAWQIILFPEDENAETKYYLRLVGFPDLVEIRHPQPLEIITAQGEVLTAPDVFAEATPASNVGQYELTGILPLLPSRGSLRLVVSTIETEKDVSLKLTPSILSEWQILIGD